MKAGGWPKAVRVLLGAYLAVHYAQLLPWAAELFSSAGVLPERRLSPLHAWPSPFMLLDTPAFAAALVALGVLAGGLLAAGCADRTAAALLWYLGACLHARNPLVANPSLPYVGWLLLAHAMVPAGAEAALRRAAWLVLVAGYSYSGLTKLASPSWADGSAIGFVLQNPLARVGPLRDLLLAAPGPLLALLTFATLALEVGALPLGLVPRLRPLVWSALTALQVGLLASLDFTDLTLGMLLAHAAAFDPAWLEAVRTRGEAAPAAGRPGLLPAGGSRACA